MSFERRPDTDAGLQRSAQSKARRVIPTASEFTKRVVLRDTRGNEYSEPHAGDRLVLRLAQKYGAGVRVFYTRPRSRVAEARNRLSAGASLRLLDLHTRHEMNGIVLEAVQQTERRGVRGYVAIASFQDTGQALELSIFK